MTANIEDYSADTEKDFDITVKWSLLQRVAEYYRFPVAVFLGSAETLPKEKTTEESVANRYREYVEKVKLLTEEYFGG
jgi:methylglyoxal synthase